MPVDMTITTDTIETDPSTLDAVDKTLFNNIDKPISDEIKGNMVALRMNIFEVKIKLEHF